ncbi:MAG: sigma-70 family RNA polymerase sigma factor [Solirubrobacterales bacterium]
MGSCQGSAAASPSPAEPDSESAVWLAELGGSEREDAARRLHEWLLRITRGEVNRRRSRLGFGGPELEDVAMQAASDATIAVLGKLDDFRGESRFTTWAAKFAILEVSNKVGRHQWRRDTVHLDPEAWDRMPERFGLGPGREAETRELLAALRAAVETELTERQRRVFEAIVMNEVPLDVLVVELDSNRNAIYKMLFDARRKLRMALVANGYLDR